MHGSSVTGWLLVALCAATGGYCLARMRTGSAAQRTEARGGALMGLGMAVMALPASVLPQPVRLSWGYAAVFGAAALWALWHRHLHHAIGSAAMVYMALAMASAMSAPGSGASAMTMPMAGMPSGGAAHAGHAAAGGLPLLTGLLLAYYAVFVIAAGLRLIPAGSLVVGAGAVGSGAVAAGSPRMPAGSAGRPDVVGACGIAMGIGMFAMLVVL
ncbi:DUF5134 domain-containing protein [Streptomyces pinistramenti]|uniref:DUF5134 domain-containing protein n=1 Tax=Streptomyces pinistramenti TaxID=2884812 RepID=UPI001D086471|nr:DUF5134 domain-containing protein [Streptomyces pinistramenti]MCB5909163.1 DUF5134 domain-containing protein [Streptomyces pinistramenti]